MDPRLSLVTLGVSDLARARKFYEEGLGWPASALSNERIVFFQAGGLVIGLYGREALRLDAGMDESAKTIGFSGFALAQNVATREEVERILEEAEKAGGTITRAAQEASWGGYSGYFADPDGHLWEIAWNPHFTLTEDGRTLLPR